MTKEEILCEDFEERIRLRFCSDDDWVPLYHGMRGIISAKVITEKDKEAYMAHLSWRHYHQDVDESDEFQFGVYGERQSDSNLYLDAESQLITIQYGLGEKEHPTDHYKISELLLDYFDLTERYEGENKIFSTKNEQGESEDVLMLKYAGVLISYKYLKYFLYERDLKLVMCFLESRKASKPGGWNVLPFEKTMRTKYYYYKFKLSEGRIHRYGYFCESNIQGKVLIDLDQYLQFSVEGIR